MKMKETYAKRIAIILCGILVLFILYFNFISFKNSPKLKTYEIMPLIVFSGSMEPTIGVGDLIFIKGCDSEDIKTNDIITYRRDKKTIVTHRVVKIFKNNSEIMFETKGDVNNVIDEKPISENLVLGKKIFKIPYLGYVSYYIKNNSKLFLVFIPLTIILGGELYYYLRKYYQNNSYKKGDEK